MQSNEIDIESSYRLNNLGESLYRAVLEYNPARVIEFGALYGYSTVHIAKALKQIGCGRIMVYDLWEKYSYKHTSIDITRRNLARFGVSDIVTLEQKNFFEWLEEPEDFDLLHLDISNDGEIIELAYDKLKRFIDRGAVIIFEGGTQERDSVEWMIKFNKRPICPLRDRINYTIIDRRWPGMSMIKK